MAVIILIWLAAAIAVAAIAGRWSRSGFGWFLLAVLFSPLLAGIFLAIVGPGRALRAGSASKICPRCGEDIKAAAQVCRFCGEKFPRVAAAPVRGAPGALVSALIIIGLIVVTVLVMAWFVPQQPIR